MSEVWTIKQAIEKTSAYCAIQERCAEEIRTKLFTSKLSSEEIEQVIAELILQGFLNEERYAKAFVCGKFHTKHWGRKKIYYELKKKKISPTSIQIALQEIDETEYLETLTQLVEKKSGEIKESNPYLKKKKLITFLISKGFEYELIENILSNNPDR